MTKSSTYILSNNTAVMSLFLQTAWLQLQQ